MTGLSAAWSLRCFEYNHFLVHLTTSSLFEGHGMSCQQVIIHGLFVTESE